MPTTKKAHGNKGKKRPYLAERNRQNAVHGFTDTPTYVCWRAIKVRCLNPNNKSFQNYGGRGIKLCKRWEKFENFLEDMGTRPLGAQIDRINNEGGYSKRNCRWVSPKENANNKRNSHYVVYKKKKKTVKQWSEEIGICSKVLMYRFKNGWSVKDAFTVKPNHGNGRKGYKNARQSN